MTARQPSYPKSLAAAFETLLPALPGGPGWSPFAVAVVAMLMAWSPEATLADRFADARRAFRQRWPRGRAPGTTYTGFAGALARLGMPLVRHVARALRQAAAGLDPHAFVCGVRVFAIDGTRVEAPRSAANQERLGCAGKRKSGPQVLVTACWQLGTGLLWDWVVGAGTSSERRAAGKIAGRLPGHSMLAGDAGFVGFEFVRRLQARQVSFLLRVGGNIRLLRQLGTYRQEGPDTVYLWPDDKRREPPLVLRLIVVEDGNRRMYLVTDVLDHERLSDRDAALLYRWRWGIETFFRGFKQTLARRRLRSSNPARAVLEMHWLLLGYALLGLQAATAIAAKGHAPRSWSAALARKAVRTAAFRGGSAARLRRDLHAATHVERPRTSSKKARDWPHKKHDPPCGPPQFRIATAAQRAAAARVCAAAPAA
jgi:hypothetical protein